MSRARAHPMGFAQGKGSTVTVIGGNLERESGGELGRETARNYLPETSRQQMRVYWFPAIRQAASMGFFYSRRWILQGGGMDKCCCWIHSFAAACTQWNAATEGVG
jgi:hypothetical protein